MKAFRSILAAVLSGMCVMTAHAEPVVEMQVTGEASSDVGTSVCTAGDGGYFLAGLQGDLISLTKVDHAGTKMWTKSINLYPNFFGSNRRLYSICPTSDHGCAIIGNVGVMVPYGEVYLVTSYFYFDSIGTPLFAREWKENDSYSVVQCPDSGFVIVGQYYRYGRYGMHSKSIILKKISKSGETFWTRGFASSYGVPEGDADKGKVVRCLADGSIVIAGETATCNVYGNTDIFLAKTDPLGNLIDYRIYGGPKHDYVNAIDCTSDGGFVLAGQTNSYSASGEHQAYVLKVDSAGAGQWCDIFPCGKSAAYGVVQCDDNGYLVCGNSASYPRDSQVAIKKLDSLGNEQWTLRGRGNMGYGSAHLVKEHNGRYTVSYNTPEGFAALARIYDDAGDAIRERSAGLRIDANQVPDPVTRP